MVSNETYMRVAQEFSKSSYCKRAQVGALLVKDGNVIAFGYNGTPKGWDNNCEDCDNVTKQEVLHAESNAIAKCAASVNSSHGSEMYCTHTPCIQCAKLIIQAGITKLYYAQIYRSDEGVQMLLSHGIDCEQVFI